MEHEMGHGLAVHCVVIKGSSVLMVKHKRPTREYYCLPGGMIEEGETPEEAATRELFEECNVSGEIVKKLSEGQIAFDEQLVFHSFLMDIGNQEPSLGKDPELSDESQILVEVRWMGLKEICEKDRTFLWASGLLGVPQLFKEVQSWDRVISYPSVQKT